MRISCQPSLITRKTPRTSMVYIGIVFLHRVIAERLAKRQGEVCCQNVTLRESLGREICSLSDWKPATAGRLYQALTAKTDKAHSDDHLYRACVVTTGKPRILCAIPAY
jgi:hypothetical protein